MSIHILHSLTHTYTLYLYIQVDEYDRLHPTQQDSSDSPSGGHNSEEGPVPDFAKTSLKGALKTFDRTFMNEMRATVRYACMT